MIPVLKTEAGYEPASGNPALTSLDGARRAPLAVVLHPSWTDRDRAAFGVFMATPFSCPDGFRTVGGARYEEGAGGVVAQVYDVEPAPRETSPTLEQKLAAAGITADDIPQLRIWLGIDEV